MDQMVWTEAVSSNQSSQNSELDPPDSKTQSLCTEEVT